jgi:hypothetical protein
MLFFVEARDYLSVYIKLSFLNFGKFLTKDFDRFPKMKRSLLANRGVVNALETKNKRIASYTPILYKM